MDLTVISTYRCNSRCAMCYIWKHPTLPDEEVSVATLAQLPGGFDNLNVSGGEPTLRKDLPELIDALSPKARITEISSNGLHWQRLEPIIKKHPNVKVRFSLEGFEKTNNAIRGEDDGFNTKVAGLRRLKELGGTDLGFATVIQDDNVEELAALYRFASEQGFELSTSALHNAFQFHKSDNIPYNRLRLAKQVEQLITAMLRKNDVKTWFRAYLNLGLIRKILGQDRLIPCTAATDFMFIDPWADVYACNVRNDLLLGNLNRQSWTEILESPKAAEMRAKVAACTQNCWMVTTARTAMRNPVLPQLPKLQPLRWVIANKLRVTLGRPIDFNRDIDYSDVRADTAVAQRTSYLGRTVKRLVQHAAEPHYPQGPFFNR
ncbi:MAG TPA: radical SAM protein [Candidatus Acidoferrales bacterium]|nr:radical SAM protein [Candidatus Acidoferrales bacterium]